MPGAQVQWGPCEDTPDVRDPRSAQCGTLVVPLDYERPFQPGAATAHLALIRFPARKNKVGSLVVNPGGPGASGVELAERNVDHLPEPLRDSFDLVGFDPRGVGASTPTVRCATDEEADRLRTQPLLDVAPAGAPGVDYSPDGVVRNEARITEYVQSCVDRTGADVLANVGTANVVKDLDALRAALGEAKLTYLGYSYGTEIGAAYAEAYPQNVRAMVLDGAIDPSADPIDEMVAQAAAFQAAFDDYAAECAASSNCPLGSDPAKAVTVYRSLVDPLVDRPAPTSDPRGLSYKDAITGTIAALYTANWWSQLTDALSALADGDEADELLALADSYLARDSEGHYANFMDAFAAVSCVDSVWPSDRGAWASADARMRQAAPFQSYGTFTGHAPIGTCGLWPVPPTSRPHTAAAPGLPTVLVVSTTGDPATPYQAGVDLAEHLSGVLLTYEATQHTVVLDGNSCVDDIVTDYLVNGASPAPGSRC